MDTGETSHIRDIFQTSNLINSETVLTAKYGAQELKNASNSRKKRVLIIMARYCAIGEKS